MIVVDAGVWARSLADSGPLGDACRFELEADPDWAAPAHAPTEVLRTVRRFETAGLITFDQADAIAIEVGSAYVRFIGPEPEILAAAWALRHNLSAYDAPYVVVAQRCAATLVTLDTRLARAAAAAGARVRIPEPHQGPTHPQG